MMLNLFGIIASLAGIVSLSVSAYAAGDPKAGARAYRACGACHSLAPGRHMTGPSLSQFWGRKAGTAKGYARYSPALKSSNLVWNERTLDGWLADPKAVVPGSTMFFRGIKNAQSRSDLIAFLKSVGTKDSNAQSAQTGGMMQGPRLTDLKTVGPGGQVTAIELCGDSYRVTTAAGELPPFWEFNLRFKTDASETGPLKGRPAIMSAGMMGDRASVIFSDPAEISAFIKKRCTPDSSQGKQ
jgi:cytochrome c